MAAAASKSTRTGFPHSFPKLISKPVLKADPKLDMSSFETGPAALLLGSSWQCVLAVYTLDIDRLAYTSAFPLVSISRAGRIRAPLVWVQRLASDWSPFPFILSVILHSKKKFYFQK